jgi:hypothetical protein
MYKLAEAAPCRSSYTSLVSSNYTLQVAYRGAVFFNRSLEFKPGHMVPAMSTIEGKTHFIG